MPRLGWRLRALVLRAIPHTPRKRWLYGLGLILAVATAALMSPLGGALLFGTLLLARWIDVRRSSKRRPQLPTLRAYFFEGEDSDALDR